MTDDPLTAALDRLQALADAATEGPWVRANEGLGDIVGSAPDVAFIAASRTALPALIEAVRAVLALAPVAEDEPSWYGVYGYEDASGRYDGLVEAVAAVTAALAPLTAAHTEAER